MGLLEKLAEHSLPELSTKDFVENLTNPHLSRRTITDEEFQHLKKEVANLRNAIMQGTFTPTTTNLRTIVAWFRACREEGFTVVVEKPKRAAAVAKPKKQTKKEKLAELAALAEDLL